MPSERFEISGALNPLISVSCGSDDTIWEIIKAQSSTVHAIGPTQSIDRERDSTPRLLTSPFVGFRPATPHQAAGSRMDPAVSVAIEPAQRHAAAAAADPLDEEDGSRSRFQGL